MADVPHFQFPFDFVDGKAAEVEQDTMDDVAGCVAVILLYPRGFRESLPGFGRPDPTFTAPLNTERIRRAVSEWEPRAELTVEDNVDAFDRGVHRVRALVKTGEHKNG